MDDRNGLARRIAVDRELREINGAPPLPEDAESPLGLGSFRDGLRRSKAKRKARKTIRELKTVKRRLDSAQAKLDAIARGAAEAARAGRDMGPGREFGPVEPVGEGLEAG
jgi:hypothetical protein